MFDELRIKELLPIHVDEAFKYFVDPAFMERWLYPQGMTLDVPFIEPKVGGEYRYEHRNEKGRWICEGHFEEFIPSQRLVTRDSVMGPDGKVIIEDQKTIVTFTDVGSGTEISIIQGPFNDKIEQEECARSWEQCFNNLKSMFTPRGPSSEFSVMI